jgi:hypothetical protein
MWDIGKGERKDDKAWEKLRRAQKRWDSGIGRAAKKQSRMNAREMPQRRNAKT